MRYNLNNTLIISISGKAGVGKTTLANMLQTYLFLEEQYSAYIAGFAYSVKETAYMIGWNGTKDESGRKLLQEIGKMGRDYNENVWVEKLLDRMDAKPEGFPEILIIDDWRFPNELDYLRKLPGFEVFTIRISAPNRECLAGTPSYNDISENSL